MLNNNSPPESIRFSPRESEIVELIAQGWSNKQIAVALGISYKTVKIHVRHIYEKMEVDNRVAAVLWTTQHWHHPTGNGNGKENHSPSELPNHPKHPITQSPNHPIT